MADSDKAKAEKLAAAKKRVEQLKKQKAKQGKDKKEKTTATEGDSAVKKTDEAKVEKATEKEGKEETKSGQTDKAGKKDEEENKAKLDTEAKEDDKESGGDEDGDEGDNANNDEAVASSTSSKTPAAAKAEQSRLRSTSFRQGSAGPQSPSADGETAADIYRKQAARIEELERQNKRLGKDAADAEKRWQKAEEALVEERDGSSSADASEVAKLKSELAALQRQNSQLQVRSASRHGPSASISSPPPTELEAQLRSKSETIENMELEVSRLRAQVERLTAGDEGGNDARSGRPEQVVALEEKLGRAEKAAGSAQRELAELKRNLDRASEKAVREGSARTSAETQLLALEREAAEAQIRNDELERKTEALEKKVATLTTLHKEHDARMQALKRDKDRLEHDLVVVQTQLGRVEAENLKMRKREAQDGGGTDNEHLDELEDEERKRLEQRLRALEAENADLRHGIWQERRKELQIGPEDGGHSHPHRFSDVDLTAGATGGKTGGAGLGSLLSALTGVGGHEHAAGGAHGHSHSQSHHHQHSMGESDSFLDDDDLDFDEEAFRVAQEEEAKARLERVREAKLALKNWEGWRLDLVESRQGGTEGIGPIFEI